VFYLHSRLLERAARLNEDNGGGSLTALADHRDPGRRRVGVYPDERHLDHRRPDLPRDPTCSNAGQRRRSTSALGLTRGLRAQTKAMKQIAAPLK